LWEELGKERQELLIGEARIAKWFEVPKLTNAFTSSVTGLSDKEIEDKVTSLVKTTL
jgi:hypothetical protein